MLLLDVLANIAEILAGIAIVVSAVRLWPALSELRAARRGRIGPTSQELEAIQAELDDAAGNSRELHDLQDVRDRLLAVVIDSGGSDLHLSLVGDDADDVGLARARIISEIRPLCRYPARLHEPLLEQFDQLSPDASGKVERIRFRHDDRGYDMRTHKVKTNKGTSMTIRVLDPNSAQVPFEALGIDSRSETRLFTLLDRWGTGGALIVFSGPLGSGKTAVLYTSLRYLMEKKIEIASIEDPVEIEVPGLRQMAVRDEDGMRLRDRLASASSLDLDALMIGEFRNAEIAASALRLATGGLHVLTSMHADDAATALIQLQGFCGDQLFMMGETELLLMAQRLTRRLCKYCRTPADLVAEDELLVDTILELNEARRGEIGTTFFEPGGCEKCRGGYAGRVAAYESLPMSPTIEEVLLSPGQASFPKSRDAIRRAAIAEGMRTISMHLLERAARGETSLGELRRALPFGEA